MATLQTIRKVVEETVERKLAESLPVELKFPLPLIDHLVLKSKKVKILLEIYEDSVLAYLVQDRDIFAEGPTVRQAKTNLRAAVRDEYEFFLRHKKELSRELKGKLEVLRGLLG